MNHKILKFNETEILVYRTEVLNEETQDYEQRVTIQAWISENEEDLPVYKFEEVELPSDELAIAFVRDFSEASAEEFFYRNNPFN
ncbi:MAG: hypothetical protein ACO1OQ_12855 [Rufibacter sp.]